MSKYKYQFKIVYMANSCIMFPYFVYGKKYCHFACFNAWEHIENFKTRTDAEAKIKKLQEVAAETELGFN